MYWLMRSRTRARGTS
uniref:Uncharacterized protein n=1 Tax=Arundo donax TaxID=35708 RepID=A0A0A9DUT3_ARUDO